MRAEPLARGDIERSIAKVAALPCDVLVSSHPEGSGLWQRHAQRALLGNAAFVDKGACRAYADKGRARLQKTLAEEAGMPAIVWRDDAKIAEMFDQAGVTGTFVVHDVATGEYVGHDRQRAAIRYVPASTYKIPNSLIGLATGLTMKETANKPLRGAAPAASDIEEARELLQEHHDDIEQKIEDIDAQIAELEAKRQLLAQQHPRID